MSHYGKFLNNNEILMAVVPRAWHVYAGRFIFVLIIACITTFFSIPLLQGALYMKFIFGLLCGVTIWHIFGLWMRYVYNILLITDIRVIDVNQLGIFRRKVSEVSYDRIVDMTWERSGVWEHVFRTGGVSLRTHGSDHIIELRPVNNPKNVQEMIRDFINVLAT